VTRQPSLRNRAKLVQIRLSEGVEAPPDRFSDPKWRERRAQPRSRSDLYLPAILIELKLQSSNTVDFLDRQCLGTSDHRSTSSSMREKRKVGIRLPIIQDLRGSGALSVSDHSTGFRGSFPLITYGTTIAKGFNSMSERMGRTSSNQLVLKPSSPNGTVARPDPELAKALEEVAKSLPKKFIVDDRAIAQLIIDYKNARSANRKGTQELNALFDKLYGVYVCLNARTVELDRFVYKCERAGIAVNRDAEFSHTLVEFYVRGRSKPAIKYAAALCQAALLKIQVGHLALRLGNVGPHGMSSLEGLTRRTSIKAMAEEFAGRHKKPRKSRSGSQ
jgi:hypothetical protein